jgi:hypothetical protein
MATLEGRILDALHRNGPMTDAELVKALHVRYTAEVNQACHRLQNGGKIRRAKEAGGWIKNILLTPRDPTIELRPPAMVRTSGLLTATSLTPPSDRESFISEDEIKQAVKDHLEPLGYEVTVAWGYGRGIDIEAIRAWDRILIEAKGDVAGDEQEGDYFVQAIGELVQRLADPEARYGLALPNNRRYQGLVTKLPDLVWDRLRLVVYLVWRTGSGFAVTEIGTERDSDPSPSSASLPPAQRPGWYPDPQDPDDLLRWWDGSQWTRKTGRQ